MEEIIKYLGNFHPVVLHLPIGAFLFTFLLFASQKFLKSNFDPAVRLGLLFSFITSIITSIFGYILRLNGDYDIVLVDRHMWLAIATTVLIGFVLYLHKKQKAFNHILSSFVFATILLTITGHNGGSLTHGKDYLKLPEFQETVMLVSYDSVHVFNDVISPIIDTKCVKCHNMSKSKGGLMLASSADIMMGGENGQIISANNSSQSKLYNYLNLPINDKMHMPPDGNSQLTENEKKLIMMWIDSGAKFEGYTEIADDTFSNEILNYLPVLSNVEAPSKKSLVKLLENNFRIERVSVESNFIDVKYVGKSFESKHLSFLLKIADNIQKMDLSNVDLSNINISKLLNFKNLKFLNLDNTKLEGNDFINLPKSLEFLIVNNNSLDPVDLISISNKPLMKKVYAYNTLDDLNLRESLTNETNGKLYFGISLQDFSSLEGFPLEKPIIEANGIEINPNPIADINPSFNRILFVDSIEVKVNKAISDPTYRYTLDETEPDSISKIYNQSLIFTESGNFNVKAFKKGYRNSVTKSFYFDKIKANVNNYSLVSKNIDPYNNDILFDGQLGSLDFRDGKWNGTFHEEDKEKAKQQGRRENSGNLIVDFDLPKNKNVSEIAVSCMESINVGFILHPESISLFDISDGSEKLISFISIPKSKVDEPDSKRIFKLDLKQKNIQKVRLKIKSNRKLPKGHVAEGQPAWVFVDEIFLL